LAQFWRIFGILGGLNTSKPPLGKPLNWLVHLLQMRCVRCGRDWNFIYIVQSNFWLQMFQLTRFHKANLLGWHAKNSTQQFHVFINYAIQTSKSFTYVANESSAPGKVTT